MKNRISAFGQAKSRPSASDLDRAATAKFQSRELAPEPVKTAPMTYHSGRDCSVTVRTFSAVRDSFYAMAMANKWKAGEAFERAVAALERELRSDDVA